MDTVACIKHHRDKRSIQTYSRIETATGMSFDDFAFFNYIFRPVEECDRSYYRSSRFNIGARDRAISGEIIEWFIREA